MYWFLNSLTSTRSVAQKRVPALNIDPFEIVLVSKSHLFVYDSFLPGAFSWGAKGKETLKKYGKNEDAEAVKMSLDRKSCPPLDVTMLS